MDIDIKWDESIKINEAFNNKLIDALKSYKNIKLLIRIDARISRGWNSRHIIELAATTQYPGEYIFATGTSFNLEYALKVLIYNLHTTLSYYDEKDYLKKKKLELVWEQDAIRNREKRAIENKKKESLTLKKQAKEDEKKEKAELKRLEKLNKGIEARLEAKKEKIQRDREANERKLQKLEAKKQMLAKKEIEKSEQIKKANAEEIKKTVRLDLDEFDDAVNKTKQAEHEFEQMKINSNKANKIKRVLEKLKSEQYIETHEPNTTFSFEEEGPFFFFDESNNYYISFGTEEWEPLSDITIYYNQHKEKEIKNLEHDLLIVERIAAENAEKIKQNALANRDVFAEVRADDFDDPNPANEPFEYKSAWYYHDGKHNYYGVGADGQWNQTKRPYTKAEIEDWLANGKNQKTAYVPYQNEQTGNWEFFDDLGVVFHVAGDRWDAKDRDEADSIYAALPANQPFINYDFTWQYHDDMGNSFALDATTGQWAAKKSKKNKKMKKAQQNAMASAAAFEAYHNEDGEWEYRDEENKIFIFDATTNSWAQKQDKKSLKRKKKEATIKRIVNEPYQNDEGVWEYFNEKNEVFVTNENNEWVLKK